MKICSSGHTEIAFDEIDECPTCALHDVFNLIGNDDVAFENYKKCTEHNVFYDDSCGCRACQIEDNVEEFIQEHTYSCNKHGSFEAIYFYHADECPACSNPSEDKQKELEEEVERLKNKLEEKEKEKSTSCHQRSSGYEFL